MAKALQSLLGDLLANVSSDPITSSQGVVASSFASSPAPSGYHWEFVTFGGELVTSGGTPVVALVVG